MARMLTVKWKMALLALLCLLVGFSVLWLWLLKEDQINLVSYEQIRLGMTGKEVQAILGGPGFDYNDKTEHQWTLWGLQRVPLAAQVEGTWEEKPDDNEPGRRRIWYAQDTFIFIRFGQDDRVTDRFCKTLMPISFLERMQVLLNPS